MDPIKQHIMIYTTDKSKKNLHLNALLEVMAEISFLCILVKEGDQRGPAKEVSMKLLRLKDKMIEAFDNLFDSKEVTDKTMKVLFGVVMKISDDIHQVTTLLNFRNSI